jgi:two-component system, cell cycle sensor histidine kinase and response regulator CckA
MTTIKNLWKLRHSALTNNIVVLLFVFGITPLAIIFLVFQHVFISQQQANISTFQRDSAVWLAENFSAYIDKSYDQTKTLGGMLGGEGPEQLNEKAKEFLARHGSFEQIAILDLKGVETARMARNYTFLPAELRPRNSDSFIQKALESHNSAIALDLQPGNNTPTIRYISPIKDSEDQLVGWLEATLNLDFFWELSSKARLNGNHRVYIIDPQKCCLLAKTFTLLLSPKDLERLPILQALADGTTGVWEYQSFQNQKVIGASAKIPATGWGVIVQIPVAIAYAPIFKIVTLFLGIFAITLLAAAIRGLIFSQHHIIEPVKALQQEIETLSKGIFPEAINVTGDDELGQLSKAFDHMVAYLKKTMVSRDLLSIEISERKQVEAVLRRREATLRSIFLTVPLGIGSLHDWVFAGGNDFFYKMTGYSEEDLSGTDFGKLFDQQTDYHTLRKQVSMILNSEETAVKEIRWRRQDGQVREIFLKFAATDNNSSKTDLVFAAMDISDLRKMEQERLRIDKLESLGILAGGIAHDFNNILTIILGNIELVGLEMRNSDRNLERLLEAEQACQRAQHLAKQLLSFAKGGLPVKKPVIVGDLLQDVVPLTLSGSNSAVAILIDDNVWAVEIDEDQIHQVINNILINADQAMPYGGLITIKAENFRMTPALGLPLLDGDYVRFSFIDEGIGINPKNLDKIFDPYYTTKQSGNGLGLTAAYSIIKNHQGYITVASELGEGANFHFYLPAAKTAAPSSSAKVATMPIRGHGRILVMDDEASIREVLSHMLHKLGYEAVCVKNGLHALEAYKVALQKKEVFDAVILDLTIPNGLGGKETLGLLLQLDPQIKGVVSSGYGDDPIMANYRQFGFKSFIAKPYKISELSLVLHNILAKNSTPLPSFKNRRMSAKLR